jgi:chromosome segregation ATPase
VQARVTALREEAIEEIRDDLKVLAEKLDRLAERAARELESIKAGVDFSLMETEIGLRLTVDDAKAHLKVIEAKRELVLARIAILRNELVEAEVRVEAVLRNLQEAQSLAVGYHENIAVLQKQAQEMLVAIRTRAETMRTSIDTLLERSSRLLKEMSGLEAAARTAA